MPRVIVTTDPSQTNSSVAVLMDEHVNSVHLAGSHAAAQLVERLAWAISDAEDEEQARAKRARRPRRPSATRGARQRALSRQPVNA